MVRRDRAKLGGVQEVRVGAVDGSPIPGLTAFAVGGGGGMMIGSEGRGKSKGGKGGRNDQNDSATGGDNEGGPSLEERRRQTQIDAAERIFKSEGRYPSWDPLGRQPQR